MPGFTFLLLLSGGGGAGHIPNWLSVALTVLAFLIVWRAEVQAWVLSEFGWDLKGWKGMALTLTELLAGALLTGLAQRSHPKIDWWLPLMFLVLTVVFRGIVRWVLEMTGVDRWKD